MSFIEQYHLGLPIVLSVYLLPTIVAFCRHHRNRVAICATNVLLGWLIIGWIVAMIWALTADTKVRA